MRSAAILTGPSTHLDHLGILSHMLGHPLIVAEEETAQIAKQFYPFFDVHLHDWNDLSLEFLANQYDVLFASGRLWAMQYQPLFELLFQKKMRFVYCPHGNSDKGRTNNQHPMQDIHLVYGKQMKNFLEKTGARSHIQFLVQTGNYRFPFYQKHRAFYDALAEKHLFSRLQKKEKSTLFYAPTWHEKENPSSFFTSCAKLLSQLPEEFNLIVKWHPLLVEDAPAQVASVESQFDAHPRIVFASDFPTIYPILAKSDAYLGDYSSIGYDFLLFDRPLIFLTQAKDSLLQEAGMRIAPDDSNPYRSIEAILSMEQKELSAKRRKLYQYAFGKEQNFEQIKKKINRLLA